MLSQKDALQWSRSPAAVEGEEPEDTADAESCGSNEASTVSGENDGKYPSQDGPGAAGSLLETNLHFSLFQFLLMKRLRTHPVLQNLRAGLFPILGTATELPHR